MTETYVKRTVFWMGFGGELSIVVSLSCRWGFGKAIFLKNSVENVSFCYTVIDNLECKGPFGLRRGGETKAKFEGSSSISLRSD